MLALTISDPEDALTLTAHTLVVLANAPQAEAPLVVALAYNP